VPVVEPGASVQIELRALQGGMIATVTVRQPSFAEGEFAVIGLAWPLTEHGRLKGGVAAELGLPAGAMARRPASAVRCRQDARLRQ